MTRRSVFPIALLGGRSPPWTLPNAPNLTSLILRGINITRLRGRQPLTSHIERIRDVLLQVASHSVEYLLIELVNVKVDDVPLIHPSEWLEYLKLPKFASLKRVVYVVCANDSKLIGREANIEEQILQEHASWTNGEIVKVVVLPPQIMRYEDSWTLSAMRPL